MTTGHIAVGTGIDEATSKAIEDGLNRFNEARCGPDPTKPLWIVCRDDDGTVLGGLQGYTQWDWFIVATLWVREESRGRGIGLRLLLEGEGAAKRHGCTRARLATVTFQAPGFYGKLGYVEVCRLPDVPPGHDLIWMSKDLMA
ncbi:GNAT family N-acetyltransferase [Methylobacterium sp. D54C]